MASAEGIGIAVENAAAAALLDPLRSRILERLREPASATAVAEALGLPRQRVNYHVRVLERAGLVEEVGRRARRGLEERVMRARARYWVVSPVALGKLAADPSVIADRFSSAYQVAVAARTIAEVGRLRELAEAAGKPLATLTLDTEVRFASAADRQSFAEELGRAVARLVAKYHDGEARGGKRYRVFAGAHPAVRETADTGGSDGSDERP